MTTEQFPVQKKKQSSGNEFKACTRIGELLLTHKFLLNNKSVKFDKDLRGGSISEK